MTFPYHFEDPFITTGVSVWGVWHEFPGSSIFDGGDLRVLSVQVRVAVTERFALLATKDGAVRFRPDLDLLRNRSGYADIAFGMKYALLVRPEDRLIVTPSLRYQMTQGSSDVLQGNGQGVWIPAVSVGWGLPGAEKANLVAAFGGRLPVDGSANSTILFYNAQLAVPVNDRFTPFVAFNGMSYVDQGNGSTKIKLRDGSTVSIETAEALLGSSGEEGWDYANLGSNNVEGDDVFSWAIGCRMQLTKRLNLGVAYSRPLTTKRHILKQRVALNLLFEL
jgi:hypothetical protein